MPSYRHHQSRMKRKRRGRKSERGKGEKIMGNIYKETRLEPNFKLNGKSNAQSMNNDKL